MCPEVKPKDLAQEAGGPTSGEPPDNKRRASLRWWIGTVVLTLFPTLATVVIAVLRGSPSLSWELIFEDGEIILASFLIATSTLISGYTVKKESLFSDAVRYALILLPSLQLLSYAVINTNAENNLCILIIVSVGALFVSVCCSWMWFVMTNEGV